MSVLRYIGIYLLIVTLIGQSTSLSVSALSEEDMAVNSLTALGIPAEIVEAVVETRPVQQESIPDIKMMTIADLLRENALYATTQSDSITPSGVADTSVRESIVANLDTSSVFGDFLIESATGSLLSGSRDTRIRLDRTARKEQNINGVKGTISVNMATGTIISTNSGELIDPARIGMFVAGSLEQTRSKEYYNKKSKSQKSKK